MAQTIDTQALVIYKTGMEPSLPEPDTLRAALKNVIHRRGYGSAEQFIEESGVKKSTFYRFLRGENLGIDNYRRIAEQFQNWSKNNGKAIMPDKIDPLPARPTAKEDGSPYLQNDLWPVLVRELDTLSSFLNSPAFDNKAKIEKYTGTIKSLYEHLTTVRRAFDNLHENSN